MSISYIIDPATNKIYNEFIPPPGAPVVPNLNSVLSVGNSAGSQTIENLDNLETQKIYQGNYLQLEIGESADTLLLKGATPLGVLHVGNGLSIEKLPLGANNSVLVADNTQPLGVKWANETGDVESVTAGTNITISGTAVNPIVNLSNPLTSDIDLDDNKLLRCAEITSTNDLILNPTGAIDANGKTLNMTNGEIHNCPLIHSQNNNDIDIEAKGTGNVVLKTANTDRLIVNDTGEWTINGASGTAGEVLLSNGAGFSPSWAPVPVAANVFNNIVYFGNATITTPLKLYYLDDAADWVLASNTNSSGKLIAFAVGTDSSTNGMWIASNTGNIPIAVGDAQIGSPVFVSSVAGEITGTQPAGQNLSLVRQVGYKISNSEIKFFLYPIYIQAIGMNGYGIATQIGGTSATITDTNQYTLLSWTELSGTRTFTISVAGLFDVLMVGGGGAGGSGNGQGEGGGGGGGSQVIQETLYLPVGTYDVNVGAGVASGATGFGKSSGFNLQPLGSQGILQYEAIGGVAGGGGWGGGTSGYNSGGASYRSGYGGNPAVPSFALYGFAGGSSNGSGNNGGGGGAGGAGSQRTTTTPATHILGGGGLGITTTFTGSAITYGAGGSAGGNTGTVPTAPSANTGSGGAGAIGATNGQAGASGYMAVRFRI